MRPRLRYALLPIVLIGFGVLTAGASVLSLEGSDRAPYENEFSAVCYSDVSIEAPLSKKNGGKDLTVHEVVVSGNFEGCEGQTMLLTASLKSQQLSYAFHDLKSEEGTFSLVFASDKGPGDWHRIHPLISDGKLVARGTLTPPQAKLDVTDISWVVASLWK